MELDTLLAPTRACGAQWSVSIRRDDTVAAVAEHHSTTLLRTASVAKVFVLMDVADQLVRKAIVPDRLIDRRTSLPVHDSGIWHALRIDALPIADLAVLVGAVSDNWATNALLDVCGLDHVQDVARHVAPGGSMLHDYVRDERSEHDAATLSQGCADDWSGIMQRLHYADGIDAELCGHVLGWLAQDADLSMVAAAFDLDPLAHDIDDLGLRLWHKTGTDHGVLADVGVVRSASAAVSYAVICNWPAADEDPRTRRLVLSTMRRIGDEIRTIVM